MGKFKIGRWVRALLFIFIAGGLAEGFSHNEAEARVGSGRSSGRKSSFGSRPSAPPSRFDQGQAARVQNPVSSGGGFMRGMAGGLAGGFLGSMLFSSLGHAGGIGAGGLGGAGGFGFIEMILLAGLAFLAYRFWKSRQQPALAYNGGGGSFQNRSTAYESTSFASVPAIEARGILPDEASDIFFKIQGAWTRRDLSPVQDLLGKDMRDILQADLNELKNKKEINRLENISVRRTEILNSWQEHGTEYSVVRFTANLLDYTTDEDTGKLTQGSDAIPVKFEENWTFAQQNNQDKWQLVGIEQV